ALAHEAARLVQPLSAAALLAAGDELDDGAVGALVPGAPHLEPEPAQAGFEVDRRRARRRMPGVEQVAPQLAHEGAVARAHQRLGARRLQVLRAGVPAAA